MAYVDRTQVAIVGGETGSSTKMNKLVDNVVYLREVLEGAAGNTGLVKTVTDLNTAYSAHNHDDRYDARYYAAQSGIALEGGNQINFKGASAGNLLLGNTNTNNLIVGQNCTLQKNVSGTPTTIITTTGKVQGAVYNDLAEMFMAYGEMEAGDVLVWDKNLECVRRSESFCDRNVVGVYSDTYGFLLGGEEETLGMAPVALAGQVWVKATGVEVGDLLISSYLPGVATKAAGHVLGTVVGKALEPVPEGQVRRIRALVVTL